MNAFAVLMNGAGNEARTRDLNLGKVALYQLSYSRVKTGAIIAIFRKPSTLYDSKIQLISLTV